MGDEVTVALPEKIIQAGAPVLTGVFNLNVGVVLQSAGEVPGRRIVAIPEAGSQNQDTGAGFHGFSGGGSFVGGIMVVVHLGFMRA